VGVAKISELGPICSVWTSNSDNAPMKMKFGRKEHTIDAALRTKFPLVSETVVKVTQGHIG